MPGALPGEYCYYTCRAHGFDTGYMTEGPLTDPRNNINNPYPAEKPYVVDGCACYYEIPNKPEGMIGTGVIAKLPASISDNHFGPFF